MAYKVNKTCKCGVSYTRWNHDRDTHVCPDTPMTPELEEWVRDQRPKPRPRTADKPAPRAPRR